MIAAPEAEPIPCRCRKARLGLMAPHRDHRAELERARFAGRLVDEIWAAAIAIGARRDRADIAR